MITLPQLLESRDVRAKHQKDLLLAYPGCTLVCLTVQLPGPEKRTPESLLIGGAGLAALLDRFGSVLSHTHTRDLPTGYEAYFLIPLDPFGVKRICCAIEDTHPLGRMMDIDVFSPSAAEQDVLQPLRREDLGLTARQCLLCGLPARECMRMKSHSREELLECIRSKVNNYLSVSE